MNTRFYKWGCYKSPSPISIILLLLPCINDELELCYYTAWACRLMGSFSRERRKQNWKWTVVVTCSNYWYTSFPSLLTYATSMGKSPNSVQKTFDYLKNILFVKHKKFRSGPRFLWRTILFCLFWFSRSFRRCCSFQKPRKNSNWPQAMHFD